MGVPAPAHPLRPDLDRHELLTVLRVGGVRGQSAAMVAEPPRHGVWMARHPKMARHPSCFGGRRSHLHLRRGKVLTQVCAVLQSIGRAQHIY